MKTKALLLFCFALLATSFAQEKKSKADVLYYSYEYKNAIAEYQKEMASAPLRNGQLLNLADSYFKLGNYDNASKIYLEVHKKNDTTLSSNRFNKMLQSLAKTSSLDRVKSFFNSKRTSFAKQLVENADFNYELLGSTTPEDEDFQAFNIGVNSPQADFAPSFYKEKLLFSTSRIQKSKSTYEPSGESYMDIYVARIEPNGSIFGATPFEEIPNSQFHEATPYFSEEIGKLFYILSNTQEGELRFDENGRNSLAIGMSDFRGELRFLLKDLSTSFYYPFFDAKSSKLYFAANFEDGYGGTDIYFVYTNNGQIMSEPTNLGPGVNSPGNEIAPYIFDNSLYFSSDVFYGIGGMDIYKTNMYADGSFGIPINLGKGINTAFDDFGLILRDNGPEGILGYFSSNRTGGKGNDDIYGFKVKEDLGLKTFSLKGRVVNLKSNDGILKAQLRLLDKDSVLIKEVYSDDNGDFRFEIPWKDQITVQATKDHYSIFSATYNESEYDTVQKGTFIIGLSSIEDLLTEKEGKQVVKIQKFYFDKGRADITPKIQIELDKVVDAVQRFPQLKLSIESHTNSKGSRKSNSQLSQRRADAIKSYLTKNGLSSSNITSVGLGEDNLINKCADGVYCLEFLHNQNERTNIVVANFEEL
ncbi:MAG: OmpA family protein [Maribacter sp.]|nr:OmpA family protein [Maribacter sp.]